MGLQAFNGKTEIVKCNKVTGGPKLNKCENSVHCCNEYACNYKEFWEELMTVTFLRLPPSEKEADAGNEELRSVRGK